MRLTLLCLIRLFKFFLSKLYTHYAFSSKASNIILW